MRTIEDTIKRYEEASDPEKQRDAPLDILHLERADIPPEALPVVLSVMASTIKEKAALRYAVQAGYSPIVHIPTIAGLSRTMTNRQARWLWWMQNAAPGLDQHRLWDFAHYLALAEQVEELLGENIPTEWLTGYLAFRPWSGLEAKAKYQEVVALGLAQAQPPEQGIDELLAKADLFNVKEAMALGMIGPGPEWALTMGEREVAGKRVMQDIMGEFARPYHLEGQELMDHRPQSEGRPGEGETGAEIGQRQGDQSGSGAEAC